MNARKTLLVGSIPFENEEDAMSRALAQLSPYLFSLPDGEIGEKTELYPKGNRAAWVMTVINACTEDTANWRVVKQPTRAEDGFPADYDKVQKLKPKHSPAALFEHLRFGYDEYFKSSYETFKRLRADRKLPDLKFQVGVPTGLGITFTMMNPIDAIRYAGVFNQRIAFEVNEIIKMAGDDVVIQVEVPGELAMAYQLPAFLIDLPVLSVRSLVKKFSPTAQVGVHICLGDLNNKALVKASTLDKLVKFSNCLVEKWPQNHPPFYIHYPLAEAAAPPTLDRAFYAPLKQVKLPAGTRFIAGFVHEKLSGADHQKLLKTIEGLRGGTVDIACSCGMGRRTPEEADRLLEIMNEVASSEMLQPV